MKKQNKKWLTLSLTLLISGLFLFGIAMSTLGFDINAFTTARYSTNVHEINDAFDRIAISTDKAAVQIARAEDGVCRVECYEEARLTYPVTVEDGVLQISTNNRRQWYDKVLQTENCRVTVYLPDYAYEALNVTLHRGELEVEGGFLFQSVRIAVGTGNVRYHADSHGTVEISTQKGDIKLEHVIAGELRLAAEEGAIDLSGAISYGGVWADAKNGRTTLTDLSCKSLSCESGTGDLILTGVIAGGNLALQKTDGDITLERCDANALKITLEHGRVAAALLSPKQFDAQSESGSVSVPPSGEGGRCEIRVGTGDITATLTAAP